MTNKLIKWTPEQIRAMFPHHVPNRIVVESVTADGAPVTIGTVIKNKHGRVNFVGPCGGFYAGSKSQRDVERYAKNFNVDRDGAMRYFIERGQLVPVGFNP